LPPNALLARSLDRRALFSLKPQDGAFDNHPAGWLVYGPGTAHKPTVGGGKAYVLYLLPGGAIEFRRN